MFSQPFPRETREGKKNCVNMETYCKSSSRFRSLSLTLVFMIIWKQANTQAATQVCRALG